MYSPEVEEEDLSRGMLQSKVMRVGSNTFCDPFILTQLPFFTILHQMLCSLVKLTKNMIFKVHFCKIFCAKGLQKVTLPTLMTLLQSCEDTQHTT